MMFNIAPYDFEPARFIDGRPYLKGYWVQLYAFFDGERVHHFFHESEFVENISLARECGYYITPMTKRIFVCDTQFPRIFNEIEDYVRRSNSYQES